MWVWQQEKERKAAYRVAREWIALPELGIEKLKVKVDSGARTSALHATDIEYYERAGQPMVRFRVSPLQDTSRGQKLVHAHLVGKKVVKSSIGISTRRPTILTSARIGERKFEIHVTLINRDMMGFRMLLGREALRGRFLIDTEQSFLLNSERKKKLRKRGAK
ncbi:MAG: RimK/LysX family protein [Bdellovibrionota bacterium]